jgi:hypothetical protein
MSSELMSTSNRKRPVARRWLQFTLFGLLLIVTILCVTVGWYADATRKRDVVRIEIEPAGVYVDSWTASRDLFASLASCAKKVQASQMELDSASVIIVVDEAATYGVFREVVEICWETGFRHFYLEHGRRRMRFEASAIPAVAMANRRLPFPMLLLADNHGQLAQVRAASNHRYDAANGFPVLQVRALAREFLRHGSEPDSGQTSVALKADDNLRFFHVLAAIDAVDCGANVRQPLFKNLILGTVGLNVAAFDEDDSLTTAFDSECASAQRPLPDFQLDDGVRLVLPLENAEADKPATNPHSIELMPAGHLTVPVPLTW